MGSKQKTIRYPFSLSGISLNSGEEVHLRCYPSDVNSGILFVRSDLASSPTIEASIENLSHTKRTTILQKENVTVGTVEHFLSAILYLGIDNLKIEIDGNELPILDGSSGIFLKYFKNSGIVSQSAMKSHFKLEEEIHYHSDGVKISAYPADALSVHYTYISSHNLVKTQTFRMDNLNTYSHAIASARTFCFDFEIESLRQHGVGHGGNLNNVIVIGENTIVNGKKFLRFKDEFVRHKILDFLGDIRLLGHHVLSHISISSSGHYHNTKFVQLLRDKIKVKL